MRQVIASPSDALRAALDTTLAGLAPRRTAQAVERLMAHYRGDTPTATPILRDRADVVAYAAYRMPATFEATRAALAALVRALPAGWAPDSHADLGGGTGAAAWAVSATWDGTARPVTVFDWAEPALALGRELAAAHPGLGAARWRRTRIGTAAPVPAARRPATAPAPAGARPATSSRPAAGPRPPADPEPTAPRSLAEPGPDTSPAVVPPGHRPRLDPAIEAAVDGAGLVTLSYVLGELTEQDQAAAVDVAARAAGAVVIVEPGSPDGYARILAARARLIAAGLRIAAPCPHGAGCPIEPGTDWCHFSVRVNRSSLHRQVKGGALPYEDEKFSYVAAVHPEALAGAHPRSAAARVLARPQLRKGQVLLDLCTAGGSLERTTVTKRHGTLYRAARDIRWGEDWPPPDHP
jgi:ribosomal protein RSM22 (predicted rRNA methylase)